MTLEEINALDSHDYQDQMRERVLKSREEMPQTPEGDYDYLEWLRTHVSEGEMEAEFLVYQDELRAVENERLRVEDIKTRLDDLKDMRLAFHTCHPDKANPAVFFKELLEHHDHEYVEFTVAEMEAKDLELQPSQEEVDHKTWVEELEAELQKENITKDGLLEALVRDRFLDDSSFIDALKPKLIEINERKPRK